MFLSLHMIFNLERADAVWGILDGIFGFDPSWEMVAPSPSLLASDFVSLFSGQNAIILAEHYLSRVKRICVMTNLTAHAQPFRGARDLAFCLKVLLDSLLVWASSGGSGETARMRRLAWTFAARISDKYQIRLTQPIWSFEIRFAERLEIVQCIMLLSGLVI